MDSISDYMTVEEAARKWNISKRRVQKLCSEGRIPLAKRFGKNWAIPVTAEKPQDGRQMKSKGTAL